MESSDNGVIFMWAYNLDSYNNNSYLNQCFYVILSELMFKMRTNMSVISLGQIRYQKKRMKKRGIEASKSSTSRMPYLL